MKFLSALAAAALIAVPVSANPLDDLYRQHYDEWLQHIDNVSRAIDNQDYGLACSEVSSAIVLTRLHFSELQRDLQKVNPALDLFAQSKNLGDIQEATCGYRL